MDGKGGMMREDSLIWKWKDEKIFINQLGKPNKHVFTITPDTWKSKLTRLELLDKYYEICENIRDTWSDEVPQDKTLLYIADCYINEKNKAKRRRKI